MKKKLFFVVFSVLCVQIFSATMNPKVRQIPKDLQENIFINPKDNIEPLVKALTGNSTNQASNVKVLHDWICDNIAYDCDIFTDRGRRFQKGISHPLNLTNRTFHTRANFFVVGGKWKFREAPQNRWRRRLFSPLRYNLPSHGKGRSERKKSGLAAPDGAVVYCLFCTL